MGLAPLLAVCCGYFMVILDVTIVNVAAPAIGRELGASLTDLQWIVDGYTVAFAGLLLLGGALGDRWGHRRVFCLGVVLFTVSSLGCAVAANALVLTAFRLLEGCGAALLVHDGAFDDKCERFEPLSWLRLPTDSTLTANTGQSGMHDVDQDRPPPTNPAQK